MAVYTVPRRRRVSHVLLCLTAPALFAFLALVLLNRAANAALPAEDVSVAIDDRGFVPAVITITTGTSVVWENESDTLSHTVTFTDGATSPVLLPHDRYERTFDTPGAYAYHCANHPSEVGEVRVVAEARRVHLSVTSSHDQPLMPGATVDYEILYENHSDDTVAESVVLTVTLPAGATLVSSTRAEAPLPPNSQVGETLVYALGAAPPDSESQLALRVLLPATLPTSGPVSLTASIWAANAEAGHDDDYTEDSSSAARPSLTLGVRPADDRAAFRPGRVVTYTLEYANHSDEAPADAVTVTLQLPPIATFVAATRDDESAPTSVPATDLGDQVAFLLGALRPEQSGRIHAQLRLADSLVPGQALSVTARIASATPGTTSGPDDEDDVASDSQSISDDGAHLYVRLAGTGDGEIGGLLLYQLAFGNAGAGEATNVRVTLALPSGVNQVDFGATPPATFADNAAVWHFARLDGRTAAQPLTVRATIHDAGHLTATASITGTSAIPEAESPEHEAVETEYVVPLTRPTIYGPRGAIVGPTPAIHGLGTPGATVSLYLADGITATRQLLGAAPVGLDRTWTITPTTAITTAGWHWVIARQALDTRVSGATGTSFVVSPTLRIDAATVRRDGILVGGVNPNLGWAPNRLYRLDMMILGCAAPISPTLQASFFNTAGLMTGYRYYPGLQAVDDARRVRFDFTTPASTVAFELAVKYDCAPPSGAGPLTHYDDCFIGADCSDDPPSPPDECEDCQIVRPHRPQPIDPDGYVYDAVAVRAGATITQSIVTRAWVTATRQIGPGVFTPWNALEYGQVNPQYTNSVYPDKVLSPGYYSFRVPPGAYRIVVDAPGFLPYASPIIPVLSTPVTFHIPLERSAGTVTNVTPTSVMRLYLPLVSRRAGGGQSP